jgi:putative Holliday junction resolvase
MALPRSGNLASDHRALARLVGEYEAVGVVVGLPFSLSGALGPAARAVLDELDQIRRTVGVSVASVDERFTTRTAATALRASGRRDRDQRAVIDQSAAAVLLQSWVDGRPKADQ